MSLTGKTIGRYRITQQLGQGGMAVVYKAFDTRLQRDVALKLIRTGTIPPDHLDQLQKRFEREALTQSRFNHPNIVHIHDYGEHEGAPYLVMAYSPGGTLQDLTGTPMPYPQAAALLAPIADALAYAHELDVLHRDVKPSNILFDAKRNPSLTDFGIAKLLGEVDSATLTGTGMGIGTPQYMAPEQWKGKPEKATDIYSLGVVFYELVTGRKPYDAETPAALVMILATEPLPAPTDFVPDLPEHVGKVLYKALAPQPEDRYASMAEFAKVLDGLSREEVIIPEPEPVLPQTEVMPLIEEQPEEPAEPEPIEPVVVPTLYPQETPTEATPLPAEPEEEEQDIPPAPKPKSKSKMPVWGWGLIGVIVLAGIVFGVMQLDFGGTPVAEVATEAGTYSIVETTNDDVVETEEPTASYTPFPTPTVINVIDEMNNNPYLGNPPEGAVYRIGKGKANKFTVSSDGKIAIASGTGVYFYDAYSWELLEYFPTKSPATSIDISSDESLIAIGLTSGNINIIETDNYSLVKEISISDKEITGIEWREDQKAIIIATNDEISEIEYPTGEISRTFGDFGYNNIFGITTGDTYLISFGVEGTLASFIDLNNTNSIKTIPLSESLLSTIAISPINSTIALGTGDAKILIVNTDQSQITKTLRGHMQTVSSVAYSIDGMKLISGSSGGEMILWDATYGTIEKEWKIDNFGITQVGFSPNRNFAYALLANGEIIIYDLDSGEAIGEILGFNDEALAIETNEEESILIIGGGHSAYSSNDGGNGFIHGINLDTLYEVFQIPQNNFHGVDTIELLSDDEVLAFQSRYGEDKITFWNIVNNDFAYELNGGYSFTITPDEHYLTTVGRGEGAWVEGVWTYEYQLNVYNLNEQRLVKKVQWPTWSSNKLRYSSNGNHIIGLAYGELYFYDIQNSWTQTQPISCSSLENFELSISGKYILIFCDDETKIYNMGTYSNVQNLPSGTTALFSPNDKYIYIGTTDGSIIIYEISTGDEINRFEGHTNEVTDLILLLDSNQLVSSSVDGTVIIWNLQFTANH